MENRIIPVPDGLVGMRLDVALSKLLGLSRTKAANLVDQDLIRVLGRQTDRSDHVREGDILDVNLPDENNHPVSNIVVEGMGIIFDDEHMVVVDKPAGIAAHAGPGWDGPTVLGALRVAGFRITTSGSVEREGIVQRLDVGTSGLMVVAKSEVAYSGLKDLFRKREVTKIYHALAQGRLDPPSATIDAPIGRHPSKEFKMCVLQGGKDAITHYRTLDHGRGVSLARIRLETGRTHQIRVHFAAIKHPLVADTMYGADPVLALSLGLNRQWLHAVELGFRHPVTGRQMRFESPYPLDLQNAWSQVKVPSINNDQPVT